MAARNLRLVSKEDTVLSGLEKLRFLWKENQVRGKEFADFEVALLRLAKDWYRRGKCRSPFNVKDSDIRDYLLYLVEKRKVATSTLKKIDILYFPALHWRF